MGYFSDLETLDWFWDIVRNREFQRTKNVTTPTPFDTYGNEKMRVVGLPKAGNKGKRIKW